MSELSAAEIAHLAKLARIRLSTEEQKSLSQELPKIVEFVEQLRAVKLDDSLAGAEPAELESLRPDEVSGERLSVEQLKNLAPDWRDGQNVVPAVFGEVADEG
ncbi:MAG TPA: Asp-tRNA(Asn)/Glu-tRNA(Gln) amidotransferase subunit GatC [Candidatus Saccharimonadales bacterium]|nr:Asp-tRNA(Asn)/Glu-tRNA(Gln) amidotransferase subunit GatC [Candidatus Saccharimonadales bacterium]